jgi:TPR repeat protein
MPAPDQSHRRPASPYQHEQALARIEAGVGRIAAGLQARRSAGFAARRTPVSGAPAAPAPTQLGDADPPWDARSAEALMRVHEAAEAELGDRAPTRRPQPAASERPRAASSARAGVDQVWLEQRLAALAATLGERLARINPDGALAALQRRLEQFEQRLEAALQGLARYGDASALLMIEAHINELNQQFAATRSELSRLEVIDARLSALSQQLSAAVRREEHTGGGGERGTEAGDAAPQGDRQPARDTSPRDLTASLEDLLEEFCAARRRDEERSANVLQGAEQALARIADRLAAMEEEKDDSGADGQAIETDRLADVYAAGARALGQEPRAFALDAADYAAPVQPAGCGDDVAPALGAGERPWSERDARTFGQGRAQPPPLFPSSASTSAEARDPRPRSGRRLPGLLPAVMVMLFATGYLGVDGLLARASSIGLAPTLAGSSRAPAADARLAIPRQPLAPSGSPEGVDEGLAEQAPSARRDRAEAARPLTSGKASDAAGGSGAVPDLPAEIGSAALRLAAVAGDPLAQFEVALRYAEGKGVAEDPVEAAAWFQRAALRGHGLAQYRLGICFERGSGVTAEPERAKAWYRRAAAQGVAKAMHNLAALNLGGAGRSSDYEAAAHWFNEAAERGLLDSQFNLALLYEQGLGVEQNLLLAFHWYGIAARAGDEEAARRLDRLKPQLAADQLLAEEQRLNAWAAREAHGAGG